MSATSSSVKRAEAVPMDTEVTMVSTWPHADLLQAVRDTLDGAEEAILATASVDTRDPAPGCAACGARSCLPPDLEIQYLHHSAPSAVALNQACGRGVTVKWLSFGIPG